MYKIDLIFIDSGGGHRAAAAALSEVIGRQQRPWDLRLLNIQDLLDSIDIIRKSTGIQFQELYNIMLRRNWTLGAAQLVPVMHMLIRLLHKEQVRLLEQHWKCNRPDMVVSLIPHYNRAFKQALERAWPGTPLVTILTDIADSRHTSGSSDRTSTSSAVRIGRPIRRSPSASPRPACCRFRV